jgi:hypothetical protein
MTVNDLLASGYRTAKLMVHRMTDDLSPAEFVHQPCTGANSAAWIVGHLATTLRRTADRLGVKDLPPVSADLTARLTATKKPAEDQTGLGDPTELMKLFDACADKVAEAVRGVPTEVLDGPPPFQGPFGNTYAEALQFGAIHVAMHVGQLSTIRRSLGKPPVV